VGKIQNEFSGKVKEEFSSPMKTFTEEKKKTLLPKVLSFSSLHCLSLQIYPWSLLAIISWR